MPDRKRILIVYYSLSGNTERVAKDLTLRLAADIERIRERANRRGVWGYLRAALDSLRERTSVLDEMTKDAGVYDLIIVGTPIWAGKITPAVRTYLKTLRNRAKRVAFFTTSGSTAAEKVVPTMEGAAGAKAIAWLGYTNRELRDAAVYDSKLTRFLSELRDGAALSAH